MKKITVEISLYEFDELDEDGKLTAINEIIGDWLNYPELVPLNANKGYILAIDECERMLTPWFASQAIFDYCKSEVMRELRKSFYTNMGEWYSPIDESHNV